MYILSSFLQQQMTVLNENETHTLGVQLCSAQGLFTWFLRDTFIQCASNFCMKCVQSASQNLFLMSFQNHRIKIDSLPPLHHLQGQKLSMPGNAVGDSFPFAFDESVLLEQISTNFEERNRHWIAFNCVCFVWDREKDRTIVAICYWCQLLACLSLCTHNQ